MANTALREAREAAGFSQDGLARAIRHRGFQTGQSNGCTREMVHRWERGITRRPHPAYVVLLEEVLGQPAANLGFDADRRHGMDRVALLAGAGLDRPMLVPDAADHYGPLSGVWLSAYAYVSSGRGGQAFTSQHYMVLLQRGAELMARSVPRSASALSMTLSINGRVITGSWTERTRADGYYRGATYHGAIQMLWHDEDLMSGKWVGFGKGEEINGGPWSLSRVSSGLDPATLERWDLAA